jgi:hypothetical protein
MDGQGGIINLDYACQHITEYPVALTSHKVFIFVSLLLVFIGLVGNALSISVFASKRMRTMSCNFYLLMLAISDSMYLISVLLMKIFTGIRCLYAVDTHLDISNRSNIACKTLQFLLDFFSDYSTCLILAFTVERYITVYFPLKNLCTVRRARMVSGKHASNFISKQPVSNVFLTALCPE